MAARVEIYIWTTCPFSMRAKNLLKSKSIDFIEYNIDGDEIARDKMSRRANGKRSLPQIFINDVHIGGYDDIYTLNRQGKLDKMLVS